MADIPLDFGTLEAHGCFIGSAAIVVLSDKDGIISIDPRILYGRLGLTDDDVSFDRFMDAIKVLEDVDDLSNLSVQGGRRIIPLHQIDAIEGNRGWLVVNKSYYRDESRKTEKDVKKEYDKGYAAAKRKYLKNNTVVKESYKVVESCYTDTNTNNKKKVSTKPKKKVSFCGWGDPRDDVDHQAWTDWTSYKRGRPAKGTVTRAANLLALYSPEIQRKMVDDTIRNGWKGIFPPKDNGATRRLSAVEQVQQATGVKL